MTAVAGGRVDVGVEAERLAAIPELEKLGNQVTETTAAAIALGVEREGRQPADKEGGDGSRD